ncbi:hypothetical protein [Erysipelothrix tonsillarum]|uniref:hypothetical protein n=1 Tax=Erysipelothrix tonsillarum TaxID=38402 RepID=UPI00035DE6BC|nr:hypothetical protein [Erysipelothrix tonsillarum]
MNSSFFNRHKLGLFLLGLIIGKLLNMLPPSLNFINALLFWGVILYGIYWVYSAIRFNKAMKDYRSKN